KWAIEKRTEIETLQKTEKFRKEFLMNLAHELRTPIFTIQGYEETLLGGALHDDEVNEKFLHNTSRSVERLANLVNDLDHISKLESDRMPLNVEKFSIQELVKESFEDFSIKAKEKNITFEFKKGTERGLMVMADKDKIKQVMDNRIENAIKYSRQNATISAAIYS